MTRCSVRVILRDAFLASAARDPRSTLCPWLSQIRQPDLPPPRRGSESSKIRTGIAAKLQRKVSCASQQCFPDRPPHLPSAGEKRNPFDVRMLHQCSPVRRSRDTIQTAFGIHFVEISANGPRSQRRYPTSGGQTTIACCPGRVHIPTPASAAHKIPGIICHPPQSEYREIPAPAIAHSAEGKMPCEQWNICPGYRAHGSRYPEFPATASRRECFCTASSQSIQKQRAMHGASDSARRGKAFRALSPPNQMSAALPCALPPAASGRGIGRRTYFPSAGVRHSAINKMAKLPVR